MAKARTYRESAIVERPPAFQQYAAAELGAEAVKLMTPAERGLYWSMMCYCWLNDSIPLDPALMARALGFTEAEVVENMTARVLGFFEHADDDSKRLVCPALVRQMERIMERRIAQARGGRAGAKARREKKFAAITNPQSTPQATYPSLEKSKDEKNQDEKSASRGKSSSPSFLGNTKRKDNGGVPDPEFVKGYEAEQAKEKPAGAAR
ncbi:MAG: hypothetical protein A3G81_25975 [Betaproteobacteria bacterium RIFCSPLOWO2_12_FULL_65_14]|nr:MAG: hypothetical protein A3G81_25975 [Betaproteobacteria bacterium RIFCSPLOWO2_12_FULL_65_14]